jgi:hypothetical protein
MCMLSRHVRCRRHITVLNGFVLLKQSTLAASVPQSLTSSPSRSRRHGHGHGLFILASKMNNPSQPSFTQRPSVGLHYFCSMSKRTRSPQTDDEEMSHLLDAWNKTDATRQNMMMMIIYAFYAFYTWWIYLMMMMMMMMMMMIKITNR